jgi:TetR/AcrR family transcriptional regulator, transcriptional repressor for nem operon
MARPKEFDQERALHRAISIFSRKGFAATSTDDLMRAMDVGRQSMYDTFGDKRELFLRALEMYVTESVQSINAELEKPGSALSSVRNALVTFAERNDLSSSEGCMGLNAICEFGQRDSEVTRITRNPARSQRHALMLTLARAKKQGELNPNAVSARVEYRRVPRAAEVEFGHAAVINPTRIAHCQTRFRTLARDQHHLRAEEDFGGSVGCNSFGSVMD